MGLPDRFRLPGLRITPRRYPSHRNHLGQRLPERTSKRVQARAHAALLDPSGNLHNPPVTHDAWINYQYQSPGGGGGGGGGGQSPTGGTIAITAPVGNADQNSDLHVSISYASGGGGYQTPNWAYRIDSAFPAYGSPHGGTQVTGTTSVNDFLSGQANGSRHAYAALLDPSGNLHNPPVTHDAWINYQYQSPGGGGGGGGGGQSPTGGTIAITAPVGNADQNSDLHVSISYASGGGGYQTPNWAYRIDSAFPAYGSPHGGTQVTGTTSVNDFLSGQANGSRHASTLALLDPSGNLHNPPVTHDAWINYQYQSPGGGGGGGGGGGQSPTGGTIVITAPVGNADQHADLQVSISYASGGGGYQTPNWAYRIDSAFPAYGSPHGGTQVTGTTSVNDFLSGQANGSRHVYVALLDPSGNLHNPPVTHDAWINYQYQSPGGGGGGGGQSPTGGTIAITAPVGNADQNSDLHVSISYASGGGGYQTPNWAYRIDSAFPAYGSPHGGTQVTGTTSVNDFLSGQANGSRHRLAALLDPSGNLHNPPVTHDAWINYQYQSPGGGGGGGGGGQSPTGGTIAITAPVGNADQHADLQVSISYASGGGGYQTPNWAYRIDSAFPAYGSPHGGTQVTGTTSVNDFLSGQANGSRQRLTPPFLTQAATYTTRPSPTTHGSTTNTSRQAAAVEVEAVASPPPAEPSRSPLRSETPTKTPTCRYPSPTHPAAEDTRRPIGPIGSIRPSRPTDHPTAVPKSPGPPRSTTS